MSPTNLNRPITEKGCIYNLSFCVCVCVCSCTSLVKIHPFILKTGCRKAIFQQSEPSCDLENWVKVTKI